MRVSEIRVKQIRVNQGLGVINSTKMFYKNGGSLFSENLFVK